MISRRFLLPAFCALCLSAGLTAAETDAPPPPGGGGSRGGGMRQQMQAIAEQLKTKYPQEYAEIERLRGTNRIAAMEKTRDLAAKAGIQLPSFNRGSRRAPSPQPAAPVVDVEAELAKVEAQLKDKMPKEFAEIEKLKESDRVMYLTKLRELASVAGIPFPVLPGVETISPRDIARRAVERAEQILRRMMPEKFAEFEELRVKDPDAAREQFRAMFREARLNVAELKRQSAAATAAADQVNVSGSGTTGISRGQAAAQPHSANPAPSPRMPQPGGEDGGAPPPDAAGGMPPAPPGRD